MPPLYRDAPSGFLRERLPPLTPSFQKPKCLPTCRGAPNYGQVRLACYNSPAKFAGKMKVCPPADVTAVGWGSIFEGVLRTSAPLTAVC